TSAALDERLREDKDDATVTIAPDALPCPAALIGLPTVKLPGANKDKPDGVPELVTEMTPAIFTAPASTTTGTISLVSPVVLTETVVPSAILLKPPAANPLTEGTAPVWNTMLEGLAGPLDTPVNGVP